MPLTLPVMPATLRPVRELSLSEAETLHLCETLNYRLGAEATVQAAQGVLNEANAAYLAALGEVLAANGVDPAPYVEQRAVCHLQLGRGHIVLMEPSNAEAHD